MWQGSQTQNGSSPDRLPLADLAGRGWTLPPHLVADLGVGRDRVAAGDQGVGETDEAGLLLGIARGLILTARSDLGEPDVLRLPDRQGELETPTTTSFDGLW